MVRVPTNHSYLDACDKIQSQVTSGTCSIAQRAAMVTYTNMEPTIEMSKAFLRRKDLIVGLLREVPGLKVLSTQGAFYVFPDVSFYFGNLMTIIKLIPLMIWQCIF